MPAVEMFLFGNKPPRSQWEGSCNHMEIPCLTALQFSSVPQLCLTLCDLMDVVRPSCPSPTPGAYSISSPLSRWCHPTISSSVIHSPPALNLSQHQGLFQWVGSLHQVTKVLALQDQVLPKNIQGWLSVGLTSLISLLSKGLSRVF